MINNNHAARNSCDYAHQGDQTLVAISFLVFYFIMSKGDRKLLYYIIMHTPA